VRSQNVLKPFTHKVCVQPHDRKIKMKSFKLKVPYKSGNVKPERAGTVPRIRSTQSYRKVKIRNYL